jgi:cell shape-determining protein MreD
MTNEQYLIVSYFAGAAVSIVVGTLVYFYLRRSFGEFVEAASGSRFPSVLKRLFPCGLIFPALMGFISVTYSSCNHETYEKIVQNREYLVGKNREQLSSILLSLLIAILVWNVVLALVQKYAQNDGKRP